jgi:hypothetical protein
MKYVLLTLVLSAMVCMGDPVLDRTLTAPDDDITGLGWGGGYLWAVDRTSKTIYKLDPATGSIEDSWVASETGSRIPTGLTYLGGNVYVAAGTATGTSAYAYRYSAAGSYLSSFSLDC